MTTYQDATRWACDQVEEKIVNGRLAFPECTFADAVVQFSAGIELVQQENEKSFYIVTEQLAAHLWLLAEEHHEFYDLCTDICAKNMLADAALPKCLRIFTARALNGEVKRPTPWNRARKRNWLEYIFLWSMVKEIARRFNLKPTRNDISAFSNSACDALAEALTVCGRKTNYSEIKRLMVDPRKKRLRDEFEACIRIGSRKNLRGLDPDATSEARAREVLTEILRTLPRKQEKSPDLP